ncbi:allantoate permease [Tothia fuscella]|uniref:Allantoate permease n=1 Tax=Tothia fuscella TaxID=1048955 RepID=A0A9P4NJL7_9PEZI|nr:allantoate permease [Tothia fuscella]
MIKDEKFEVTIDSPTNYDRQDKYGSDESNRAPSRTSARWPASIDERKLVRKIDWSIIPILMAAYFLQFLDKVIYNYASVMGMPKELGMKGNDFSWGATAFFLAYTFSELPQAALIQKYRVTKVLGGNIFCWGIVLCCTAAVKTSHQMIAVRALLGCFEAVITPALMFVLSGPERWISKSVLTKPRMITSAWYQRNEAAPRFGLWYCGLGLGQIIGGAISFGAQHGKNSFQGWRLMFLIVGVFNCIVAAIIYFWLAGTPEEATFLSSIEKEAIAQRLHDDHSGLGAKKLRVRSIFETFLDSQTWLLCLLTILNVIPSGVITTYSAILIKNMVNGDSKKAALLNMPSGIFSIVALIFSTYTVRKGYQRWFAIILAVIPTLIGACLMSFLPKSNKAGLLIGIYLVNFAVAPYAIVLSAAGANFRGYTRKVAGGSIIAAAFSIANIIGPQTFQAKDAPNYYPAKITLVASTSCSILVALALRLLYGYRNARAERLGEPAMSHLEAKAIRERMSVDFADPGYRYEY